MAAPRLLAGLLCWLWLGSAHAQGVGPQTSFLAPVGLHSLTTVYGVTNSNFRLGQTLIGRADIETSSVLLNYAYRFALAGRYAQFTVLGGWQDIVGAGEVGLDPLDLRTVRQQASGVTDPALSLRVGLLGAPAMTAEEWLAADKRPQVYLEAGVKGPWGDYESRRLLNPGFNRYAFNLALPMVIPLDRARRTTFLEVRPEIVWFTDNDEPPGLASVLAQDEVYIVEAHLSHHLTGRFWASLGMQAQWGGETVADGVPSGNRIDQYFWEGAVGYVFNRNIAMSLTYGEIFASDNGSRGDVWRARLSCLF